MWSEQLENGTSVDLIPFKSYFDPLINRNSYIDDFSYVVNPK